MAVPTIHLRNVPPEVYDALKRRASASGRSLNAEAVDALRKATRAKRSFEEVMARIEERARRLNLKDLTPPEDVIRKARDSR